MKPRDLKHLAEISIEIQNACNLSGVLHTWADSQALIRDDAQGGKAYLRHHANVLFLSKVVSLMVVNADCLGGVSGGSSAPDLFRAAYDWAKKESGSNE